MDEICQVKCCGTFLDAFLVTLWSEYEDISLDEVVMDHIKKIEGVDVRIHENVLDLVDPLVHLACSCVSKAVLLICPVCCNTFFRNLIHTT